MTSYIQFIGDGNFGGYDNSKSWWNALRANPTDFLTYLKTLSHQDQLRFICDQTIALSYFFWIYGTNNHEFATSYSKDIKDFTEHVLSLYDFEGPEGTVFQAVKDIQSGWYGTDWVDVSIKVLKMFLYDLEDKKDRDKFPRALTACATVPYLMQRNRKVEDGYEVWANEVLIPHFSFATNYMVGRRSAFMRCCCMSIGTNFIAKLSMLGPEYQSVLGPVEAKMRSLSLTYPILYLKTALSPRNFETILRDLASQCYHRDNSRNSSTNYELFYAVSTILNDLFSLDFLDITRNYGRHPLDIPGDSSFGYFLVQLLGALNKTQGVKMISRELFVKFFGSFVKDKATDLQKVVAFVEHHDENVASAEELSAFQTSLFGSCEAIELISHRNPVSGQETGTDKTGDEPTGDGEEDNLDLSDLPELDDAKPALEAEGETADEDQDTTTDGDQGEDDSSSNEEDKGPGETATEDSEDDNSSSEENSSGDENEDPGSAGADAGAGAANDTQAGSGTPEDLDASDDEGIVFRVSPEGSETVDSVVYREELDQFISDILVNPPKKLSPQAISALTSLQQRWLHLLTVETITGILEKIVSLPEKFKKIKNNSGENS